MRSILYSMLVVCVFSIPAQGTVYWVSPAGNDAASGIDPANAWLSIDNGDAKLLLSPGDTIRVISGTYYRSTSTFLVSSGTATSPITYLRTGRGPVVINLNGTNKAGIVAGGAHLILDGLTVTNTTGDGVQLNGDSCVVRNCRITKVGSIGLHVSGNYGLFFRNVIYGSGDRGIKNEDGGKLYNLYYNNVIYSNSSHGVELKGQVKTARLFNNIVVSNGGRGISGPVESVCGFNNVWGNTGGNYVGVVDTAGGISKAPKFVNSAAGRYDLKINASEIDAGLDLGFEFNGAAPDIGAFEKHNVYYVAPSGDDSQDGRSPATAWATIGNGDSLLYPGDTVHIAGGTYTDSVILTDGGVGVGDEITFTGLRDSSWITATGAARAVTVSGDFVGWSGISIAGASETNLYITGTDCTVEFAQIEGAGQYGIVSAAPVTLRDNTIFGSGKAGAVIGTGTGTAIHNNTFFGNGHYGVVDSGTLTTFVNSIFVGHDSAGVYGAFTSTITYCLFHNNAFATRGGVLVGFGSILADPLFLDTTGGFYLTSNSPAIDAGTDLGFPFVGSAPEIGAREVLPLVAIAITPMPDTLSADSSYQFAVAAIDSIGNPADPGTLIWSHTFASGAIGTTGLFQPQLIGDGRVAVAASPSGLVDTTAPMTVAAGSLAALMIAPERDTVSADSTRQFAATGRDAQGNPVAGVGALTWSVLGGIGSIDTAGLFAGGNAGAGFVHATSDLGPVGTSDTILVVPGALVYINVVPETNTLPAGDSAQYSALGYDADSNFVLNLTELVTWTTDDPTGTVSTDGMYTAGVTPSPPDYYIRASYLTMADSGRATVLAGGALDHIHIVRADSVDFPDTMLTTDIDTTRFYALGHNAAHVVLGQVSVQWHLIGADTIGALTDPTGSGTTLTLTRIGTGRVVALYTPSIVDTSGTITCQGGAPARLVVSPDSISISADSTKTFQCATLDADGNPSDPSVVPGWSVLGGIGSIAPSGLFTPGSAGTGQVVATGGPLADTAHHIQVTPGALTRIAVTPDSAVVSADSTRTFVAVGYDANDNVRDPGSITWSLTTALGTIDSNGVLDATTAGTGRVVAVSNLGPSDTSQYLRVVAGKLVTLTIAPESVSISADSSVLFSATGFDNDGNPTAIGSLNWTVVGDIGDIGVNGVFVPQSVGVGRIAVAAGVAGIVDTNTSVVVTPGVLNRLGITPDTATIKVGDTVHFTAQGYDQKFNPTSVGQLSWDVQGTIGSIDATGMFVGQTVGWGRVSVTSSIRGVTDTTGTVAVEGLIASAIPIGTQFAHPGDSAVHILTLTLNNPFDTDKLLTAVALRDTSSGLGSRAELLSNIDSVLVYCDVNHDSLWNAGDTVIARAAVTGPITSLSFPALVVAAGQRHTLHFVEKLSLTARDGDSLDAFLRPATDVYTQDGTTTVGTDPLNSLGHRIIDGSVAAQLSVIPLGNQTIPPAAAMAHLATFDVPRNGYQSDTLLSLSVSNRGTASSSDLDSLVLFADNGDSIYQGHGTDTRLGRLVFTGDRWTASGIRLPITSPTVRLFVAGRITAYPTSGANIVLSLPKMALDMASGNDGPLDHALDFSDTTTIVTSEALNAEVVPIGARKVVPGRFTGSLLSVRLASTYGSAKSIDSLRLAFIGDDPRGATAAQIESQIDSVLLYLNRDANPATIGPDDSLLATTVLSNGTALLRTPGLTIAGQGGTGVLIAGAWLNAATSRNGNHLGFSIAAAARLFTDSSTTVTGSFPLANPSSFEIDAFTAAQVSANSVPALSLFGGQANQLMFDFRLPRDGYAAAQLNELRVVNYGAVADDQAISELLLWGDLTGNGHTPDDLQLGMFWNDGDGWVVSGLTYPLNSLTTRFQVTASLHADHNQAGTLQFGIPTGGVRYKSGTTGPDDTPVISPTTHLVFPANNVTVISLPLASQVVTPGAAEVPVLSFALYNGYSTQVKHLTGITLANTSRTTSTTAFADGELGQVSLYRDANGDRALGGDLLIGSGSFSAGHLNFTGLDVALAPESLSYLHVGIDLPYALIDQDSLAVSVETPAAFAFGDITQVNGDLPLVAGGYRIVNGSVKGQYKVLPVSQTSISPGDTSIPLFAFRPAANGNLLDFLESVTIRNIRDADSTDIAALRLWVDANGNDVWDSGDSLVVGFTPVGGQWIAVPSALPIRSPAPALFVLGDIAPTARPGAAFAPELVTGGCQYASTNDGPYDGPLSGKVTFAISTSSLRASHPPLREAYSVGETLSVVITATNLRVTTIDSVISSLAAAGDAASMSLLSSPPPLSIAPGATGDFEYKFAAVQPGSLSWQLWAIAPALGDTSAPVQTQMVTVQTHPTAVPIRLINSIPASVTRGQANVYPLSLTIEHPDTTGMAAALRVDSLCFHIHDANLDEVLASSVFSRMALATGYSNLAVVDSLPDTSMVDMVLSTPLIVHPGEKVSLSLLVDIDSAAAVNSFGISLDGPACVSLADANSGIPVALDSTIAFPLSTASCRIDNPSRTMLVSSTALMPAIVNAGQQDAPALLVRLRHPGLSGSSQIQLSRVTVTVADEFGLPTPAAGLIDEISLLRQQTVVGRQTNFLPGSHSVPVNLSSPLTLNPGDRDSLIVAISLASSISSVTGIEIGVTDSTSFDVRDLSSGSPLATESDTILATSLPVFPMASGVAAIQEPAVSPRLCLESNLAASIVGGVDTLSLLRIPISYPAGSQYASICLSTLEVTALDASDSPLDPNLLFDRIGYRLPGQNAVYQPFVKLVGGRVVFELGTPGIVLNPGDSTAVELIADIEADVPYANFVVSVEAIASITITDFNDTTHHPPIAMMSGCGASFPYTSPVVQIYLPAGRPVFYHAMTPVRLVAPAQQDVLLFESSLEYDSPIAVGDLNLTRWLGTLKHRTPAGLAAIPAGSVFSAIRLQINGTDIAVDSALSGDSVVLSITPGHVVSRGDHLAIELRGDIRADAAPGNYLLQFSDSTFATLADRNLGAPSYPILASGTYPVLSAELSLAAMGLAESFTNYPNPFNAAAGEQTTIGFALTADAYVSIELFTVTGERVAVLLNNELRVAGAHQDIVWAARNGSGRLVMPGVYFCQLSARYLNGDTETVRRKVAVVR